MGCFSFPGQHLDCAPRRLNYLQTTCGHLRWSGRSLFARRGFVDSHSGIGEADSGMSPHGIDQERTTNYYGCRESVRPAC